MVGPCFFDFQNVFMVCSLKGKLSDLEDVQVKHTLMAKPIDLGVSHVFHTSKETLDVLVTLIVAMGRFFDGNLE